MMRNQIRQFFPARQSHRIALQWHEECSNQQPRQSRHSGRDQRRLQFTSTRIAQQHFYQHKFRDNLDIFELLEFGSKGQI